MSHMNSKNDSCGICVSAIRIGLSFIADITISVFTDKDVYSSGEDYQHNANDARNCDHYFYWISS